jgi:NTP pyrophosphatase (non-canonical NTP hydrolase)
MEIQALQAEVRRLRQSQGWPESSLEQKVVYLLSELGELADEIRTFSAGSQAGPEASVDDVKERLGMEIYDVVWHLCDIANLAGIDLQRCFVAKTELNRRRRW